MKPKNFSVAIAAIFIWIGAVVAISFMEAWLKFQAPGITIPLGLGIGRLVFAALNKLEWVLAISILVNLFVVKNSFLKAIKISYSSAVIILILQSFWLLPALGARTAVFLSGSIPENSYHHFLYIGLEAIKIISLFVLGCSLLKSPKH